MKSSEVIYCSSCEDEPIFDCNQRLIQEHGIREEQQNKKDHFSRVLDEVKEGKHKYLRVAALHESSSLPREVPIDPSLSVSIAYEPSDLKFNIMSQHSETGSRSSSPIVADSRPLRFEALQYKSTITNIDQISAILRNHGLRISLALVVRVPTPDKRSCHAPKGSDKHQFSA